LCCSNAEAASNCLPDTVTADFSIDGLSVYVTSNKDLSNVVLKFCDGTEFKFDGLSGLSGTFTKGKTLAGVWIKSGCNQSGDGPGYGQFFETECPECEGEVDQCGICNGPGPNECGSCDGSVIKDACGVCGGSGPGECGCDFTTVKDECGVCLGEGTDRCGLCPGEDGYGSDDCVDCLGEPFGSAVEDPVGACCEDLYKDECGLCDGNGKDDCGLCPQDENYGKGLCDCENLQNPVELDALAAKQLDLAHAALRAFKREYTRNRGPLPKKLLRRLSRLSAEAHGKHIQSWSVVWLDFGQATLICPDTTDCEVESLVESKDILRNNSRFLHKLAKSFSKKAGRLSGNKRKYRRLLKKSSTIFKLSAHLMTTLPDHKSICE
jgi:hypothetical protein